MTTTLPAGWKPISSAPKDGTEILAWRSDCGQFIASYTSADSFPMTQDEIDAYDEATLFAKDWFTQWPDATRLDGSEAPTLWQPLPAEPCQTCNDQGAVGNVLTAEPCPDCTPPASAQDAPITVSVDPDPRGVSVGVWQGSRCIYTGAHAVPVGVQDDALGSLYRDANEIIRFQAARDFLVTDGMPVFAAPAAGDALPTIKGAAITGGYVVVTPSGWGEDKPQKVRDAILRLFPVKPAYTPKPEAAIAASQQQEG